MDRAGCGQVSLRAVRSELCRGAARARRRLRRTRARLQRARPTSVRLVLDSRCRPARGRGHRRQRRQERHLPARHRRCRRYRARTVAASLRRGRLRCDDACVAAGDCCSDACDACGACRCAPKLPGPRVWSGRLRRALRRVRARREHATTAAARTDAMRGRRLRRLQHLRSRQVQAARRRRGVRGRRSVQRARPLPGRRMPRQRARLRRRLRLHDRPLRRAQRRVHARARSVQACGSTPARCDPATAICSALDRDARAGRARCRPVMLAQPHARGGGCDCALARGRSASPRRACVGAPARCRRVGPASRRRRAGSVRRVDVGARAQAAAQRGDRGRAVFVPGLRRSTAAAPDTRTARPRRSSNRG